MTASFPDSILAGSPPPPKISELNSSPTQQRLRVTPYPAAHEFKILRSDRVDGPFNEVSGGLFSGYDWTAPNNGAPMGFYRLQVKPLDPKTLLTSTVLHRLTYGPTPDELERVTLIGPDAYIAEQLAPETIQEDIEFDKAPTTTLDWQYVTVTGTTARPLLYIYFTVPGDGYIDDLKVVRGAVPEVGQNLIRNGDFETPLSTNNWTVSTNLRSSALSTEIKRSGNSSLHVVASTAGTTQESAIYQNITSNFTANAQYTLSYWYLPSTNLTHSLIVRFSGSLFGMGGIASSPDSVLTRLTYGAAEIPELQAWYAQHAVQSKRQLLEVLTQFFDNHFTTLYSKSLEYMDGKLRTDNQVLVATDFEFRELSKWRQVLMIPNGTFYDLLKISAQSPAMTIYLDTVTSTKGAANENYARELMELFTMGVDNGYDQTDIEQMARAWTGLRVDKLPPGQENNPLANPVANVDSNPGTWALRFARTSHDTTAKTIFAGKTIDARFGPPYAGKSYQLSLPARTDTNGIKDIDESIVHLANLPYTQEYLSVKLCRLFVSENFRHGVYDYTDPNLSAEGQLVRDCMKAWDSPAADGRKGNIRNILQVIFNSQLFREDAASRQKVKTPFEFTVSAVRAIRAAKPGGGFTADANVTDMIADTTGMNMRLFYREEPDGFSEFGKDWINTSSLVARMRYVQKFLAVGNTKYSDPVGLIKMKLPAAQWRDAAAVSDYFLGLFFTGEGKANLDLDRSAAIAYLNTNEAGTASSPFTNLDPNAAAYDARVRSFVAMLMSLPRFQEQ